jgi:hypothetical protein
LDVAAMTEPSDQELAGQCLSRAIADVDAWLALVEQGQLASVAPFGQMFVYQLRTQGRLGDRAFAIGELCRLYYRRAGGKGDPAIPEDLRPTI